MANINPGPSRRTFLARLGQAGGASAVYHAMTAMGLLATVPAYAGPPKLAPQSGRGARVVILGAGIAGLVSALELGKAGEATVGGRHGERFRILGRWRELTTAASDKMLRKRPRSAIA